MTTFTDLERQLVYLAIQGGYLANSDDAFHAHQGNTYGHFADALRSVTDNRFGAGTYDEAAGSQDFSGWQSWERVCQDIERSRDPDFDPLADDLDDVPAFRTLAHALVESVEALDIGGDEAEFRCDSCGEPADELNQRCDIPVQGAPHRCAFVCDECEVEFGRPDDLMMLRRQAV